MIRRRAIGSAALCLIVGACGGGGGGHSAPPDTTPETFAFTSAKDLEPNVVVESAAVVIAGIDAPAPIAVVGGEYAIDGGSFTSAASTVSIGQRVRVRVTTPSNFATTAAATLTIGSVGGTFSVTTRLPDIVPDNFSFTAAPNTVLGASVESGAITVSGIEAPVPISVSSGEYAIGGGAFTSAAGTVSNGQQVRLRLTSSTAFSTTVQATLTVGGVTATFEVTTYPLDSSPDAFSFTTATNVVRGAIVNSDSVPITGINTAVTIAVTGGEYSINGGAFTSASGTITNGQPVQLRTAASTNPGATVAVTLAVGTGRADFTVTTSADVTPPAVTVLFPPRQTRTGGDTVVLRGTASDDSGALKLLRVNGVPVATSDGYAHWTATVPLAIGNNSVVIDAEDMFLNSNPNAAQLAVRRHPRFVLPYSAAVDAANGRVLVADVATASLVTVDLATGARSVFSTRGTPDSNQPFQLPYNVALDTARNRALIYDASRPAVLAVDLASGVRSVVSDATTPNASAPFANGRDIALDAARNRLLVLTSAPSIIAVDLDTGARTLLSDATTPNTSNPFATPWAMAVDSANGRALVTDVTNRAVYAVDLSTGARSILSDDTHPGSANPLTFASSIVVDATNHRALVMQGDYGVLTAIDLATGIRTVLSAGGTPNTANPFGYAWALAMDEARSRVIVVDQSLRAVLAVDLATGARSYISRDEPAGTANPLSEPRGVALDPANGRLLVADREAAALLAVNVQTADRTIVANNQLPGPTLSKPRAIVLDSTGARAFALDENPARILAVDLTNGGRAVLTDAVTPNNATPLSMPSDVALDSDRARLLVTDPPSRAVIAVDLTSGARTLTSGDGVPSTANPLTSPQGIAVDPATGRALVTNSEVSSTSSVLAIALDTGARSVLSANGVPDIAGPFFVDPNVIVADGARHQAFFADRLRAQIFRLDLTTGSRSVVSGDASRGGVNPLEFPAGIAYDPNRELLYVSDANAAAVMVVDAVTGQRVYLLR